MSAGRLVMFGALVSLCAAASGCQFAPRSQLSAAEARSRALQEQSQAQLAELENLKNHARKLENQLLQAEQDLAMVDERTSLDKKRLKNYEHEREKLREEIDGLATGVGRPVGFNRRLAELAKRYPALKYDATTGVCKLESDVFFGSGESSLNPDSRRVLDEFSKVLASSDAHDFRVMVVGHTDDRQIKGAAAREKYPDNWHLSAARALNVADYLKHKGLSEEQVGIAGFGPHEPISQTGSVEDRQRNRRVEIFVMAPDTPIVGWTETLPSVYR
ncbi:MAG TPA: OmpA family protein [Pirellulales bacterium]|nr:OmpA family protein [Pirellulales bacterium]